MKGNEKFVFDGESTEFDFLDFWRFHFSNIYDLQDKLAEFIVSKALGVNEAQNDQYWTLWDVSYRGKRIEVKETSYYHSFNEEGKVSNRRSFGITMANGSYDTGKSGNEEFCRQNDIYVFCLNIGDTRETSYPLNLNNWEFYIVPTSVINEKCGNNKTISLGRIKGLGFSAKRYNEIKTEIDRLIDLGV
jgi:hypothetical protein